MRKLYLVTYDIRDPKRLRRVFKTMRNWGNHLQLSVFECELNQTELVRLKAALKEVINSAHDQVLLIELGRVGQRGENLIEALGQPYVSLAAPCFII
jgi:CRISPR-associated protein Cas2